MSKFELKTLDGRDVFPMVSLIKKFGVENFKKLLQTNDIRKMIDEHGEINGEQLEALVGMNIIIDVLAIIVENMGKCEQELFTFLARVANMSVEEVGTLPLDVFGELITEVLSKKELKGFFAGVFKLLK